MPIIHYQFEAIHLFSDGNGRTGRVINSLYLVQQKLLELPVLYLSGHIIKNKNEYYRLLRSVTENGEWEPWILYMLNAVEVTAVDTRNLILAIRDLFNQTAANAKEKLPSRVYSKELIEVIFRQPYAKGQFPVDEGIAERKTAVNYLKELEKIDILSSKKVGKEVLNINKRLYEILSKDHV